MPNRASSGSTSTRSDRRTSSSWLPSCSASTCCAEGSLSECLAVERFEEERAHLARGEALQAWVSKLLVAFDRVLVAPPVAILCQVAGLLEVVDDLGCGAFGDT